MTVLRKLLPALRFGGRLLLAAASSLGLSTGFFLLLFWVFGPGPRPAGAEGLSDFQWLLLRYGAALYYALPLAAILTGCWLLALIASWLFNAVDGWYWRRQDRREQAEAIVRAAGVPDGS